MEERPDSALAILSSIPADSLAGDEERARYALLMSMVLDKNWVDTADFSVLQPAIDYHLRSLGLNDNEIGYLCLYAIGLNGKEVGLYLQRPGHVNLSMSLRRKLGMEGRRLTIARYIRGITANFRP